MKAGPALLQKVSSPSARGREMVPARYSSAAVRAPMGYPPTAPSRNTAAPTGRYSRRKKSNRPQATASDIAARKGNSDGITDVPHSSSPWRTA